MSTAWRDKRHDMLLAHLHPLAGNAPFGFFKSISGHCALRNSPGRTNTSGAKPKRAFRHKISLISIDSPEQFSDTLRLDDRSVMLFFRWWQCAAEIAGGIALRSTGRDSIAKNLSAVLHGPMGGLQCTAAFDAAQHCQQLRRFDFRDGPLAQPRKYIIFKPPQNAVAMTCHPSWRELRVPFTGDSLKTLCASLGDLFCLARFARIDAERELLAGSVALLSRRFQTNVGIDAKGKPLLLPTKAIFPAPPLAAGRADFKIKPAAIENLKGFSWGFSRANFYVGQAAFGGISLSRSASCPQSCPHNGGSCSGTALDHAGHYIIKIIELQVVIGLVWNWLERQIGGGGGNRTPVRRFSIRYDYMLSRCFDLAL